MDVTNAERNSHAQSEQYLLLMDRLETDNVHQHIIDITSDQHNDEALSSSSHNDQHREVHLPRNENQLNGSTDIPTHETSLFFSPRFNYRDSTTRRVDGYGHHRRGPLDSGLWISVELVVTVSQIIASIVVLSLSRNEHPQAPLFAWIVGYASGCVAFLPILYWQYQNCSPSAEQDTSQQLQRSSGSNPSEPSYTAISVTRVSDEENSYATESVTRSARIPGAFSSRFNGFVDHFKMALDCFFAVWFVVGNVWIFGGHASPSDAPKLYRLCLVFLTFSCIGYAMPFILCATICCCLPCIISVWGIHENLSPNRGASIESINALPVYKFKLKENENGRVQDVNTAIDEGGVLAAGTEKERLILGEDAVCCICLVKYVDDDELRELPCFHVFHVECIDKWLKINASCPLCKNEVCTSRELSPSAVDSNQQ